MDILEQIIADKRAEVARSKRRLPPEILRELLVRSSPPRGFAAALRRDEAPAIIAEIKRASPVKGVLKTQTPMAWDPVALARAYAAGGASAISVLTDVPYFWGHADALVACRDATGLPVLRKDFIVDSYQVLESRWLGADAILLIARYLAMEDISELAATARELGMDVLIEIHGSDELGKALVVADAVIGINNRDLSTQQVDLGRAARISEKVPANRVIVAESGLRQVEQVRQLVTQGVRGFLIGEHLATHADPTAELRRLRGV